MPSKSPSGISAGSGRPYGTVGTDRPGPARLREKLDSRSTGLHLGVLALLLLLAVLAWWRVWVTGHPTSTITCACGDPSQELWLFAWFPYALSHGINPLFTHLLEAGQGGGN